jgi:capsular polysaccharide biosynthesis protein
LDSARVILILRRFLWLIALAGVIAGAAAYGVSSLLPKRYVSEAWIVVGSLTETSTDQLEGFTRLAERYGSLATTTPVLTRVAGGLGLVGDIADLRSRIEVRPTGQGIIRISASAGSAPDAAATANALAAEIILLGQPGAPTNDPSLATIVQPGLPPDEPAAPNIPLNTLLAALLGLAFGAGISLLVGRSATDPRPFAETEPTELLEDADFRKAALPAPGQAPAPESAKQSMAKVIEEDGGSKRVPVSATVVYVSGTSSLEAGRRYQLLIDGSQFRILGPLELDPSAVALDRAVAGLEASVVDGRLLISEPAGKSGFLLALMLTTGMSPVALAGAIVEAAREPDNAARSSTSTFSRPAPRGS